MVRSKKISKASPMAVARTSKSRMRQAVVPFQIETPTKRKGRKQNRCLTKKKPNAYRTNNKRQPKSPRRRTKKTNVFSDHSIRGDVHQNKPKTKSPRRKTKPPMVCNAKTHSFSYPSMDMFGGDAYQNNYTYDPATANHFGQSSYLY
jgi:hypothetical protein